MRTILLPILWVGLLASSCRSSRVMAALPAVRQPFAAPGPARKQPAPASTPTDSLLPPDPSGHLASRPTFDLKRQPAEPPVAQTTAAITPAAGPDPATRRVNILGGAIEAVGIGLVITADTNSFATRNEAVSWNERVQRLAGLFLIMMGVILLLYQGKNGRGRLRRQARAVGERQAE